MSKHRKLYEDTHGEIEPSYHVHHLDWNHNNNVIDNLISLPRKVHELIHGYLGYVNREEIIELTKLYLSNKNYRKKSVSYLNSKLSSVVDTNKGCDLSISCRDRLDKQIERYHEYLLNTNKRVKYQAEVRKYIESMCAPPKEKEPVILFENLFPLPTRKVTPKSKFRQPGQPRRLKKL